MESNRLDLAAPHRVAPCRVASQYAVPYCAVPRRASSRCATDLQPSPCQWTTLPCGLRVVVERTVGPVVYAGVAVDAGTRDESPCESGMAHLVEHLLFKGTERRRAWHVLSRLDSVGGELNAFTTKEETVIHATFLTPHLARALDLLLDIALHSTFPQREMDREVEVIVDEIRSYEDEPQELIFDEFEELLFPGHPLGRNILGDPDHLRTYRSADVQSFCHRLYRPERMVVFVRGEVDFRRVVCLVQRFVGDQPALAVQATPGSGRGEGEVVGDGASGSLGDSAVGNAKGGAASFGLPHRLPPPTYRPVHEVRKRGTHQAHVVLGCPGYASDDSRRTALYLLSNLLGGPAMNSRLNLLLRERSGLVYQVETSLTSYTDTGVFAIYLGCDVHDVDRCLRLTHRELQRLIDHLLTPKQLAAAQRQLIGQLGVASDHGDEMALALAKAFLHQGHYDPPEALYDRIRALSSTDLQQVARDLLEPEHLSTLVYR